MKQDEDDKRAREAQRIIRDAGRDSYGFFGGAFQQLFRSTGGNSDDAAGDAVERWARRIGRTLGAIFAVLLLVNLFTGWFF